MALSTSKKIKLTDPCPCGSGLMYGECCQPYLECDKNIEQNPIMVLRTRFCANKLRMYDYILKSWHPDFRPKFKATHLAKESKGLVYTKLEILNEQFTSNEGWIEYKALFRIGISYGQLHEKARFLKLNGVWYYADGDVYEAT